MAGLGGSALAKAGQSTAVIGARVADGVTEVRLQKLRARGWRTVRTIRPTPGKMRLRVPITSKSTKWRVLARARNASRILTKRWVHPRPEPLRVGVTHTRFSADSWNHPGAVDRAKNVLRRSVTVQNQHVMGWGAENPNPAPGRYDWSSLDQRVALMRQGGGEMVLTLCGAPDWMKGGQEGTTDWSAIERAPLREHYDDFARLAVRVAQRYPDVRRFVVWNELKGFFDERTNDWDISAYTQMYNTVYRALKAHDPGLLVGGPYVVIDSGASASSMSDPSRVRGRWGVLDRRALRAVGYWLRHAEGADFLAVDGWSTTHEEELATDPVTATRKFAAATRWLRSRTDLPVWWMEVYAPVGDGTLQSSPAVMGAALRALKRSGATTALLWNPQGSGGTCHNCLWTDTASPGGGTPTPFSDLAARYR